MLHNRKHDPYPDSDEATEPHSFGFDRNCRETHAYPYEVLRIVVDQARALDIGKFATDLHAASIIVSHVQG
jgi:hypothetical protein